MLCNDLGFIEESSQTAASVVPSSGRTAISVKEAVRIAQTNNFMGLICNSRLLVSRGLLKSSLHMLCGANTSKELVPALTESIKTAGLVLVSDLIHVDADAKAAFTSMQSGPDGLDGMLENNAVLQFSDSIDM